MKTQRIRKPVVAKIQNKIARLFEQAINPAEPIAGWAKMSIEQKLKALTESLTSLRKKLVQAVEHNQKYRSSYLWRGQNFKHVAPYADLDLEYWIDGLEMSIDCGAPRASCRHLYYRSKVLKNGKKSNFSTVNAHIRWIDGYLATIEEVRAIADDEIYHSLDVELTKRFASGELMGIELAVESNDQPINTSPSSFPLNDMTI